MPDPRPPHIALIGMMAVGKTTTGRTLAGLVGARFVDTDEAIAAETGRSPRQLWEEGGEDAYRPLERAAVARALGSPDSIVLATPGGVAVDDAMADEVRAPNVTAIYLRAGLDTLVDRVGDTPSHRPLLGDRPRPALERLLDERAATYVALADLVVDVDRRTPAEVVAAVVDGLGAWPPG